MDWGLFTIFLGACCAAAATGSMFPPGPWYQALAKPSWTPPNWVFPVAWTALYLCLAVVGARLAPLPDSAYAMAFWALQIALNTLWSPVFFGLRRLRAGLVIIGGLWLSVLGLLVASAQLDRTAALLVAPYLLWVTIAAALNLAVVRLNPEGARA